MCRSAHPSHPRTCRPGPTRRTVPERAGGPTIVIDNGSVSMPEAWQRWNPSTRVRGYPNLHDRRYRRRVSPRDPVYPPGVTAGLDRRAAATGRPPAPRGSTAPAPTEGGSSPTRGFVGGAERLLVDDAAVLVDHSEMLHVVPPNSGRRGSTVPDTAPVPGPRRMRGRIHVTAPRVHSGFTCRSTSRTTHIS